MNADDAKFILRAHRADGRYPVDDPLFAEAMAEVRRDPELAAWLAREQALDSAVAQKLDELSPPPGLREAILVGARASRPTRRRWRHPWWLAAAASVAVMLAIGSLATRSTTALAAPANLAEFGIDQLAGKWHTHGRSAEVAALAESLSTSGDPLGQSLCFDCDHFAQRGCFELSFDGQRVYEVCFQRNGQWYHLFVMDCPNGGDGALEGNPRLIERSGLTAAMWSRGSTLFAVATKAGPEALRSVL